MNRINKKYIIASIIVIAFTIIDQITKALIASHFFKTPFKKSMPIIKNFFHIIYVENTGITFGMLKNLPDVLKKPVLVILPLIIMCFLVYLLYKIKDNEKMAMIAISLILSGAVGNIIDRIRLSYVVDFLYFNVYFMWWPAFNVADAVIVVGMGLLFVEILRGKQVI